MSDLKVINLDDKRKSSATASLENISSNEEYQCALHFLITLAYINGYLSCAVDRFHKWNISTDYDFDNQEDVWEKAKQKLKEMPTYIHRNQ